MGQKVNLMNRGEGKGKGSEKEGKARGSEESGTGQIGGKGGFPSAYTFLFIYIFI